MEIHNEDIGGFNNRPLPVISKHRKGRATKSKPFYKGSKRQGYKRGTK